MNSKHILRGKGERSIISAKNGFTCVMKGDSPDSPDNVWLTASVDDNNAVVDHCWFRGGWFDSNTITWKNISEGILANNPPVEKNAPGASIFVPFKLKPGEEKTIRLQLCWYAPNSRMSYGRSTASTEPAFGNEPAPSEAADQSEVTGFIGNQFVNTYYPSGDNQTGTLVSPEFMVDKKYLKFLVGGGNFKGETCVNLKHGDEVIYTATGKGDETLREVIWDLLKLKGKKVKVEIVDQRTGGWGHILADQFVMTNKRVRILFVFLLMHLF